MMLCVNVVKPDPVSELQVVESLANSATLTWKSPEPHEIILFRVSVKSLADSSEIGVSLAFLSFYMLHTFGMCILTMMRLTFELAVIS